MTFDAFKDYVTDVLAKLVLVCIEKHQPSRRAGRIMRWARTQARAIWDSFEAHEATRDVATALYLLSATEV